MSQLNKFIENAKTEIETCKARISKIQRSQAVLAEQFETQMLQLRGEQQMLEAEIKKQEELIQGE